MILILFDGVCNLCNRTVRSIIMHDKRNTFKFASLQSSYGKDCLAKFGIPASTDSVILIRDEQIFTQSTAVIEIAKDLSGWPNALTLLRFLPKGLRDWGYNRVAKYRYRIFGKTEFCDVPSKEIKYRFLG